VSEQYIDIIMHGETIKVKANLVWQQWTRWPTGTILNIFSFSLSVLWTVDAFLSQVCLNWSNWLFGKKNNLIFSHSSCFFDASAPFWAMVFTLQGFRDSLILRRKDVSPTSSPQPWRLVYLILSGTSLKFCPVWVALPVAKLPPVWLGVQASSFYHDLQALDKVDTPSRNFTPSFDSLSWLMIGQWWHNGQASYIYYEWRSGCFSR